MKQKNGKIEIMRFVFSVIIILFHCHRSIGFHHLVIGQSRIPVLNRGYFGVEFFFVISGLLMAKSIHKKRKNQKLGLTKKVELGRQTIRYILKRYITIFSYHIMPFVALIVLKIITRDIYEGGAKNVLQYFFNSIPEFFFLQKFGFTYTNVDVIEWYISAMLIAMMILYPIIMKYYYMYTRVVGPLLSLYILGLLQYNYGTFADQDRWVMFGYGSVFRAIAEISLGACAFELSRYLSHRYLTRKDKYVLTAIEVLGFGVALFYSMSSYTSRYEIHVLIFLTLSVVLSFSGQTYGEAFWNQKWVYALGRISLPLYLCQLVGINVVCGFLGDFPKVAQTVLALAITLGMALLSIPVGDRIYRWIVDKRKATKYNKLNAPFEG